MKFIPAVHVLDAGLLTIELPGDGDALDTLRLRRSVLEEQRWFITEPSEFVDSLELQKSLLADLDRSANSLALVGRLDGVIVGVVYLQGGRLKRMRHTAKLEILVHADHRGAGIGKHLLAEALIWAKANPQLEKVGLAVFAHNARAIALYEGFGFSREGHRPREYKLDDGTYWDDLLMFREV
ncbi:MAG: GNAT family N-acetyltransferase [Proteobacteria bacterium]|nr:GNAT family N-acetyltransferase [Pseudomonadota bacterium]MCP4921795.1 GNAT family N-acetyltransferase [Pseudomonadota bacterium]